MQGEFSKFNVSVGVPKGEKKAYPLKVSASHSKILNWISSQSKWEDEVKEGLVKILSAFPTGAYDMFIKNIDQYVAKIRRKK